MRSRSSLRQANGWNMANREGDAMNKTKMQAAFLGLFTSVFSGTLLFLVLQSIGVEGTPAPEGLDWLFPIAVGAALGFYAAKLSLRVSAIQENGIG